MSVCLETERLQLRYMKAVDSLSGNVQKLQLLRSDAELRLCNEIYLEVDSARTEVEKHREQCGCWKHGTPDSNGRGVTPLSSAANLTVRRTRKKGTSDESTSARRLP